MNRLFAMLDDSNKCAISHNAQAQGVVFDLKRYAIHDGPGIRTTVFLKGCPLRCSWCHNPESWREGIESNLLEQNDDKSLACDRENKSSQTVGRLVSPNQLMKELERDVLFYDESGGGVTFSGGEPLMQIDFLEAMLRRCRDHEIHTAIDTTCHDDWSVIERIVPLVNLFLCDLKLMDSATHEQYTHVPNEQILDNLKRLNHANKRIFIRMPIVPGVNDDTANIEASGHFLSQLSSVERVDLLPYHAFGQDKAGRMSLVNTTISFQPPSTQQMQTIATQLGQFGLKTKIGG